MIHLRAADLFRLADQARDQGDYATAERSYRALIQDDDLELRSEARFRLARMYANQLKRLRDAAVLLRRILDDKPEAAPVRLELARVLAELGDYQAARRELRAVQAAKLPAEVEQHVRFFANALSATKRFGGGIELALAPSTNVNRATRSDTLGTVIGDFLLSDDAKAQSGIGISFKGHSYVRHSLGSKIDLLARASGAADVYRKTEFDDVNFSLQAGPQWRSGSDRLALSLAANWRWYGLKPYSSSYGLTGNWEHPLSPRTQLRIDGTVLDDEYHQNEAQSGKRYTAAIGIDHAFSFRAGGGVQIHSSREVAEDPGYSTASGGISGYFYREVGQTTAVLSASYRHLEADARLLLFSDRRKDDNVSMSLAGTFRMLTVGTFAPVVRLRYERNFSTVTIYDFDRFGGELGLAAAF